MTPYRTWPLLVASLLTPLTGLAGVTLQGKVVLVGRLHELTPAKGVTVILEETGDSLRTKAGGLFNLPLPNAFLPGERITLQVRKEGWRIQYPLDGELLVPTPDARERVEVRLLEVGSRKFWSDDRIEKFIADTAARAKEQVTGDKDGQMPDFGRYIKEWATQYGFSAAQAGAEIDRWVAEVQQKQDDFHKLGLAAFAEKNFGKAGELFLESAAVNAERYRESERRIEQEERKRETFREKTIRDYRLAGDANYTDYAFEKALAAYREALSYADREQHPRQWAEVTMDVANTYNQIGIRTEGAAVHEHLGAAVTAYRAALEIYTRELLPQDWAITQNNLGLALQEQGIRTGGEEGRDLLAAAVTAYRQALEVRTRAELPQDWAMTENNLGVALQEQGIRTGGEAGRGLLAEAVTAYRQALQVFTRVKLPQDWAMTQNNLGNALSEQGVRSGGEAGQGLLAEAAAAYRQALEVFTRDELPQQWATTQNNLGTALQAQGIATGGDAGRRLLAEAEDAYRRALLFYTYDELPQQWATTQNNLGNVLFEQGVRTDGEAGRDLLDEAGAAYRRALLVYTHTELPQQCAMTQNNLGAALQAQGIRTEGEAGRRLLAGAVTAYRQALQVFTREELPQQWAAIQNNLGAALQAQGIATGGKGGRDLLAEAEDAYRWALEVRTRTELPPQWSETQRNLLTALKELEDLRGMASVIEELLGAEPDDKELYNKAHALYHETLFDFPAAHRLTGAWLERHPEDLSTQCNFAEAHLTTGRFNEAEQRLAALIREGHLPPETEAALRILEIANLLALGKSDAASARINALKMLVQAQPRDFAVGGTFGGTMHFIAEKPRFAGHWDMLLGLIAAAQGGDRQTLVTALDTARDSLDTAD